MKQIITFFAIVCGLFLAKATKASFYSEIRNQVETASALPVSVSALANLCKTANGLPSSEDELQQGIYRMVCAGLISAGNEQAFDKLSVRVKQNNRADDLVQIVEQSHQAGDVVRIEQGFPYVHQCRWCNGTGKDREDCSSCGGSGDCPVCKGEGKTYRAGLSGVGDIVMPCARCSRTGKCPQCKGSGDRMVVCPQCSGKRRTMDKNQAQRTFENLTKVILALVEEKDMVERGFVKIRGEWMPKEELERRQAEEEMYRDRGLVKYHGKWMTKGSVPNAAFTIFQIVNDEFVLCKQFNGQLFCLRVDVNSISGLAEGQNYRQDLYRCNGNFTYETEDYREKTVPMFALELEEAENTEDETLYTPYTFPR